MYGTMKKATVNLINTLAEAADPFEYRDFCATISPETPEEYTLNALETSRTQFLDNLADKVEPPTYETIKNLVNLIFE